MKWWLTCARAPAAAPCRLPQKENEEPMAHSHFKAEGDVEFKAVLFVPGHAPHGASWRALLSVVGGG